MKTWQKLKSKINHYYKYKMKNQSFLSFLLLTLVSIQYVTSHKSTKINCLTEKFYSANSLSLNVKKAILDRTLEEDLFETRDIIEIPTIELFGQNDVKIQSKIEELLVNYDLLPKWLQNTVSDCFSKSNTTLRNCQAKYPEEGCEAFNDFLAVKNCPVGYESLDLVYCVPKCPFELLTIQDDKFTCLKQEAFSLRSNEERNAKVSCPDNFVSVGDFLCLSKCPLGWVDLGSNCEKPLFKRRDYEVFYHQFDLNEESE